MKARDIEITGPWDYVYIYGMPIVEIDGCSIYTSSSREPMFGIEVQEELKDMEYEVIYGT